MANSIFDFCGIWSLFANPVTYVDAYVIVTVLPLHFLAGIFTTICSKGSKRFIFLALQN